jgi:hypothetical protein
MAITLAHGVDEDATYCDAKTLDPEKPPERWRDLRSTHILQSLLRQQRHASCCPVPLLVRGIDSSSCQCEGVSDEHTRTEERTRLAESLGMDPARKTVLYISTVGDYEFMDKKAPQGLGQQVWQALYTLQNDSRRGSRGGYNVLVSLHPLLEADGLAVRLPLGSSADQLHPDKRSSTEEELNELNAAASWQGRRVGLVRALRGAGMLSNMQQRATSLLSLIDVADLVIAPVSSGSATTVLRSPSTPLVLLRARTSWGGDPVARIAEQNFGLVLGNRTARVLDDSMVTADLISLVESELTFATEDAVQGAGREEFEARARRRTEHRRFWFGQVDGFEEVRTWLALLAMHHRGEFSGDEGVPDEEAAEMKGELKELGPLFAAYAQILGDNNGEMSLADATDHPVIQAMLQQTTVLGGM